jgi:hypothetical protein
VARFTAGSIGVRSGAAALLLLASAWRVEAQTSAGIRDNSFLIEEAYNQEAGVVQHINAFARPDGGGSWAYALTQEWPLGGFHHQVSYTMPLLQPEGQGAGIGDVPVHYRYQLVGHPDAHLLLAPRLSLLLPTGHEDRGRGTGEFGVQVNVPFTYAPAAPFAFHGNAGTTLVREASPGFNFGASAIWLARPSVNFVLEGLWLDDGEEERTYINPGIRWAINTRGGLQIVPGIAYTIAVGPSHEANALFLYLSFEHPFKH